MSTQHVEAKKYRQHVEQMLRHTVAAIQSYHWPKMTDPKTQVRKDAEARYAGLLERRDHWEAELARAEAAVVESLEGDVR